MARTDRSSRVDWSNPYAWSKGVWYKGSIHIHSFPASACAKAPLESMVDRYVELGFDFISVSDHMRCTKILDDRIMVIPGLEWNNPDNGEHTGVYALDEDVLISAVMITNHGALLRYLEGTEALVILNHPNWQLTPHYSRRKLLEAAFYHGIEIFNNVVTQLEGSPNAENKWDDLLSSDRRVLGFASDDSHSVADAGCAWIVVRATDPSPASIMEGIKRGSFYCSTGVNVRQVARVGNRLCLETENAEEITAFGEGGRLLEKVRGRSMRLALPGLATSYVRLVARGKGGRQAWTQPFYVS